MLFYHLGGKIAIQAGKKLALMKETGYKAHFAGAVEALASSGGLLVPPVMGSAAFRQTPLEDPFSQPLPFAR
jgi:TRAP-type C4-dicarboxylate transport system permease large subunit